ncbi:MAG TPA: 2-oxo acid dehydrogenase subunit E2 [Streptosporangiaceae bacterium]|nr:2-oxo acid dehydrogenase subunit E2 [Streptosporangiaceae bacterium]
MREVTIPSVGMAMTEAVLNTWLKNPGDSVAVGEAIAEIETDKSSLDLESPSDGVLGRHLVSAGASVPVGQVIVRLLEPGEIEPHDNDVPRAAAETAADAGVAVAVPGARDETVRTGPEDRVPHTLSPRKRRELREQADAEAQAASGRRGARFRAAIAEHVSESWRTIPHFAVVRQIDARSVHESLAAMRGNGLPATVTDLLLRALALAVEADTAGDIGLAVATPDGVVIPVVAGVPGLGPAALVAARAAAVARGREGQLSARDLAAGPVASLSNLGGHGVDSFTGIIPAGQKLLLTTGTIADRPVAVDGLVTVRPSFAATLNVDHRHFDGDNAARILAAFQSALDQSITWAATWGEA